MSAAIEVCFKQGHNLKEFIDKEIVDPSAKVVVKSYKILCAQCGTPLEKIADAKPPRVRRKSEPKAPQEKA